MCQSAVERAIGKLVTDERFRATFGVDAARASLEAGLRLSPAELEALVRIPVSSLEEFASRVDDSIRRLAAGVGGRS